jgi:hypothetical protein
MRYKSFTLALITALLGTTGHAADTEVPATPTSPRADAVPAGLISPHSPPVPSPTPHSPEAAALLAYLRGISGQHTMTGQHNFPNTKDQSTQQATQTLEKTPAIFGQDFGFARPGDKDAAAARPDMIQECIRQWQKGSIVVLCWHAVPPTANEPVVFQPRRGAPAAPPSQLTLDNVKTRLNPTDDQLAQIAPLVNEIVQAQANLTSAQAKQADFRNASVAQIAALLSDDQKGQFNAIAYPGGTPPGLLASVQGQLTDAQWHDVLTPGTDLYKHWCAQVDVIAGFLKILQAAHVPVLWRPYHEMNGDWFWWGGRRGEQGTTVLYRQIYDRFVSFHKLDNLVWIWSLDRPSTPARQFVDFYPGKGYFDVASLDVYGSDFKQSYYDQLLAASDGSPIALGEVSPAPTAEVLRQQPKWAWWMVWAGMAGGTPDLAADPLSYSQEDPGYISAIAPVRTAAGLPPLHAP